MLSVSDEWLTSIEKAEIVMAAFLNFLRESKRFGIDIKSFVPHSIQIEFSA